MLNGFVQRKIYMTAISSSGGASAAIQTNQMSYGSTNNTGFILQTGDSIGDRFLDYLKGFNIELPNPNMALNYEDFKKLNK